MFFVHFVLALESKAPKPEDIEEEDDDVPGMQCHMNKKKNDQNENLETATLLNFHRSIEDCSFYSI